MDKGLGIPVIAGLAIGIWFVTLFALIAPLAPDAPVIIKLNERWDKGQKRAIDVLLTNPDVRAIVAGKNFEVTHCWPNFPQESLTKGVCDIEECVLIQIFWRSPDGTMDCHLKTLANLETRQVDRFAISGSCK